MKMLEWSYFPHLPSYFFVPHEINTKMMKFKTFSTREKDQDEVFEVMKLLFYQRDNNVRTTREKKMLEKLSKTRFFTGFENTAFFFPAT